MDVVSYLQAIIIFMVIGFLVPFCVLTSVTLFFKGREGLNWSMGTAKSAGVNVTLSIINGLMAGGVYAIARLADEFYYQAGIPHIPSEMWSHVPVVVVAIIYLLAFDFADYWNHRLLHTRGIWAIHAVHHSDTDMNFTTSNRVHILEALVMLLSYTVLLTWLGLPAEVGALLSTAKTLYNKFVHIDADIHFGPLTKVFATPRFHRWHHADDKDAYDTNFANIFSFWDVLFGTYYVPGAYKGPLGYDGNPGHNLPALMMLPAYIWADDLKVLGKKLKESQEQAPHFSREPHTYP